MERALITVQQIWTSPNGKVEVITTPEQHKYHVYNLALHQYFTLTSQVAIGFIQRRRESDQKLINEVQNVFINNEPVLKAETEPPNAPQESVGKPLHEFSGPEVGLWWKNLGDDLRSGHIDRTTPIGKALRKIYFAQMFRVLEIKIDPKIEKEG